MHFNFISSSYNKISGLEIIEDADDEDNGFYPVHKAVLQGDCCKIISLFEEGHDINAVDNDLETPIVVAINHKQYNVLKLLLSYNDDAHLSVTAADVASYAVNPLLLAVSHGDEEAVQVNLLFNFSSLMVQVDVPLTSCDVHACN